MRTKRWRYVLIILMALVLLSALGYGGWVWYDGHVDRSGWVEKEGVRFYRDFHARPVSGWLTLPQGRYYLHDDGTPYHGWQTLQGERYYFGQDGVLAVGWQDVDGRRYYFDSDGTLYSGWLEELEGRCYLTEGLLATGWQEIEGRTYFFDAAGLTPQGLLELDGKWYCFDADGSPRVGDVSLEGGQYRFGDDGVMVTGWTETEAGQRYYLPDGPMAVGWTLIDDKLYCFGEGGERITGWVQEGEYRRYLQEDGTAAVGPTQIGDRIHYFTPKGIEVLLVNALNPIPEDYTPDLKNVTGYHDVDASCYEPLLEMLAACEAEGIQCSINSAYRTTFEQKAILQLRTQEHMEAFDLTFQEARDMALETVAIPGTSEHCMGLSLDLVGDEARVWLAEHCWEYGFILRYPENKMDITGITNEPWHFRYVGREVSMDMKDTGMCLEEYLGAQAVTWDKVEDYYGEQLYEVYDLEELAGAEA